MAEQFKNLGNFKKYQKEIYDFISNRLVEIPLFFSAQPYINKSTIDPTLVDNEGAPKNYIQKDGGLFQPTIKNGLLSKGRLINEPLISFDNIYQQNKSDLNVLEYIALKLNGKPVSNDTLEIDAYIWRGIETNFYQEGIPISQLENLYAGTPSIDNLGGEIKSKVAAFIPYLRFKGTQDRILLNSTLGYNFDVQDIYSTIANNLTSPALSSTQFENLMTSKGFIKTLGSFNFTDETGDLLPIGVKKRLISKKLLRDTTETEISEILPENDEFKIKQFFNTWTKLKQIIPPGFEYIVGSSFINNGDFGGGIGPGSYQTIYNSDASTMLTTEQGWLPVDALGNIQFDVVQSNSNFDESNPWNGTAQGREFARVSQRIIEKENPGFSPFVLSTQRNAPAWYKIQVDSNLITPGLDYTLSVWSTQDNNFNPNNYAELQPGVHFFYKVVAVPSPVTPISDEIVVQDWPFNDNTNFSAQQMANEMRGEEIATWQGETLWTQWKKTITIPEESVDINGNALPSNYTRRRIHWYVGYQNTLENVFDGSETEFYPGGRIRANGNNAKQYFTSVRVNRGTEVSSTNKIDLSTTGQSTIAKVLDDCVKILEPSEYDIPIYSKKKVQSLLLSQEASATVITLLTEIRKGLIDNLQNVVDSVSDTFGEILTSITSAVEVAALNNDGQLSETALSDIINTATDLMANNISDTGIVTALQELNVRLRNEFGLLESNVSYDLPDEIAINNVNIQSLPQYETFSSDYNDALNQAEYDEGLELDGRHGYPVDTQLPTLQNIPVSSYRFGINPNSWGGELFGDLDRNSTNRFYEGIQQEPWTTPQTAYSQLTLDNLQESLPAFMRKNNGARSNTPIGAMYHSEMVGLSGEDESLISAAIFNSDVGVNFDEYDNNIVRNYVKNLKAPIETPGAYPNAGYGPYSRQGIVSMLNNHYSDPGAQPGDESGGFGLTPDEVQGETALNPVFAFAQYSSYKQRIQEVAQKWFDAFSEANPEYYALNIQKQFQGMSTGNVYSEEGGLVRYHNFNFEPLREYTVYFGRGADFMQWCYPTIKNNHSKDSLWGWHDSTIINGTSNFNTDPNNPENWNTRPPGARSNYYQTDFTNPYNGIAANNVSGQYLGVIAVRCYEPHWEWNPMLNSWVYRFAQPVMGLDVDTSNTFTAQSNAHTAASSMAATAHRATLVPQSVYPEPIGGADMAFFGDAADQFFGQQQPLGGPFTFGGYMIAGDVDDNFEIPSYEGGLGETKYKFKTMHMFRDASF